MATYIKGNKGKAMNTGGRKHPYIISITFNSITGQIIGVSMGGDLYVWSDDTKEWLL